MNIRTAACLFVMALLIAACGHHLSADKLYGQWKYVKIDHPKGDGADTTTDYELQMQKPYILFKTNNQLEIWWGGKMLSHGSFKIEDPNIQYTEQLPDGTTRTFPFWVSSLDDKKIVFQTLKDDESRVTAVKQ